MKALLDTNILIDYLNGIELARTEINRYERPLISIVSWMEVMVGATPEEEQTVRNFLNRFARISIDTAVAETAVKLRRTRRLKLPDAIIWSSAQVHETLLVSRNTKDFSADEPGIRVPYQLV